MPTAIAHQRARSTLSFRIKTDKAVISIGAIKNREYASASDMRFKPNANRVIIATPKAPRSKCSDQRTFSTFLNAPRYSKYRQTSGKDDSARKAVTCMAG